MTLTGMQNFLVLEQERNFTRAAAKLHMTQQSLSSSISALEKETGCRLFERSVPLRLTRAGSVFKKYASQILELKNELNAELEQASRSETGILKIGIAYTRGRTLMPDLAAAYKKKYAKVRLEIHEGDNLVLFDKLRHGEIDLAIGMFEPEGKIRTETFYDEELLLLCSKRLVYEVFGSDTERMIHLLSEGDFRALRDFPMIFGDEQGITGMMAKSILEEAGIRPKITVASDNLETQLSLCLRDLGACFCQRNLAASFLSDDDWKQLHAIPAPSKYRYPISFAYCSGREKEKTLNAFMDLARECLARLSAEISNN